MFAALTKNKAYNMLLNMHGEGYVTWVSRVKSPSCVNWGLSRYGSVDVHFFLFRIEGTVVQFILPYWAGPTGIKRQSILIKYTQVLL